MLVERGLQVMNVEAVGEAYAIASNYLRRSGAIADNLVTNEQLIAIIVVRARRIQQDQACQQGDRPIRSRHSRSLIITTGELHGSRDRPHHADL
jgi:hypothetical protein